MDHGLAPNAEGGRKSLELEGGALSEAPWTKGFVEVRPSVSPGLNHLFPRDLMESWKDVRIRDLDSNPDPVACRQGPWVGHLSFLPLNFLMCTRCPSRKAGRVPVERAPWMQEESSFSPVFNTSLTLIC